MLAQEFLEPSIDWFALSPMLVLLGGGLLLLVAGALTPTWPRGCYAVFTSVVAAAAGGLAMFQWDDITDEGTSTIVSRAIAFDTLAEFLTITICVAVILVSLLIGDELRRVGIDGPEVYALLLMAAIGGVVMSSANDLIVMFVGLETLSLAFYVLAASDRRRSRSQESGMKYFVLGSFSSAFFLYGIALLYGGTGSTNIGEIVSHFQNNVSTQREDALILAGVALMMVGLGFKAAAVPFHVWTPDVYEGAPTPVTAFMASAGKAAAFAAMLRVLVIALPFHRDDWRPVVWVLAVLSLVVGSALAVVQSNVKRMLAYSAISHAGFVLVGVEAAGHRAGEPDPGSGMPSVAIYLLLYSVLVIGSFGVVSIVERGRDGDSGLDSFKGLAARRPTLAIAFTVFLLAQAGVPLTSGFVAKFAVIRAAVEERSYAIGIIAMVAAVIAAFLYLRIIVNVWLEPAADGAEPVRVPFTSALAITGATVFTVLVGVWPGWLLDATDTVTQYAR
ncbi:MAG: NADH-quinone oxidoreductase subunit N [Ilumatobacteraceae bacterium]